MSDKEEYVNVDLEVSEELFNRLNDLAIINKMSVDEFASELLKKRLNELNGVE